MVKIFVCLVFVSFIVAHNVVINIDPDEMQRIAEILVEDYLTHNLMPQTNSRKKNIIVYVKKVIFSVIQLCGITLSLVGANLMTKALEPSVQMNNVFNDNSSISRATPNISRAIPMQICDRDFGCDRNVCWRSCGDKHNNGKKTTNSWCFTTPDLKKYQYKQCNHPSECSPCWECLGSCNPYKE